MTYKITIATHMLVEDFEAQRGGGFYDDVYDATSPNAYAVCFGVGIEERETLLAAVLDEIKSDMDVDDLDVVWRLNDVYSLATKDIWCYELVAASVTDYEKGDVIAVAQLREIEITMVPSK